MFSSPQNAFCFTTLSRLVLEVFRYFENHAQNLNTPQNNLASWDLQMGFNSAFKGLTYLPGSPVKSPAQRPSALSLFSERNTLFLEPPSSLTEVLTLTEVFLCFFLSCKANARVKLASRGTVRTFQK